MIDWARLYDGGGSSSAAFLFSGDCCTVDAEFVLESGGVVSLGATSGTTFGASTAVTVAIPG